MSNERFSEYRGLGFESFRALAGSENLSLHQRIGFPDEYREGYCQPIIADILRKLPTLGREGSTLFDIGCGCGELAQHLQTHAMAKNQRLILNDSAEVLAALPAFAAREELVGRFPEDVLDLLEPFRGQCDAVICYSVFQYIFVEGSVFAFLDQALSLLAPGGYLLIGDVPSESMLQRFLASSAGRSYHRKYSGCDEDPVPVFNRVCLGKVDDAVLLGMIARGRAAGFHGWLMPQGLDLPMANRREDLVFMRP
ncbi:class I SAM-dependent methyltransferase [Stutzerimonas kunmingensis]|uniref:class I SAM-dependent methyltransferase n=1 Tax=Stutzerimonas kunmingensis TaxID=1211807 RepID=UPI00241C1F26|nr:class I SAM-dependent methyltransferase [Stutzerimonas kunmingensis]